jgi:Zn-dependent peptidase ImmA (M78 family)
MGHDGVRLKLCVLKADDTLARFSRVPLKPPIPIEAIAAWLGFRVILLSTVGEDCSGLVSTRDRLIGINARHNQRRRRFSVGHEIAHILLGHPPESRCSAREIALYNAEADECAAELLMPGTLLTEWIGRTLSVRELARIFDVSDEAMERRMNRVKRETEPSHFPLMR